MTIRDLPRALGRRWGIATGASLVLFTGFLVWAHQDDPSRVRARARVSVATPAVLLSAHGGGWLAAHEIDPRSWLATLQSRRIREAAVGRLRQMPEFSAPGRVPDGWALDLSIQTDASESFLFLEALTPDAASSAALANALAETAREEGLRTAAAQGEEARRKATKAFAEESTRLQELEAGALRAREEAMARHRTGDLEVEDRKLQEEILAAESRRRELDRQGSSNRLRLERIRQDRSALDHFEREAIPRTASVQIRAAEHPELEALRERVEKLRRDLNAARRTEPGESPAVLALRGELRQAELELARAESIALGRDLAAEELSLRGDNELLRVEASLVESSLRDLRARGDRLGPVLADLRKRDREIAEVRSRLAPMETLKAKLTGALPPSGYVEIHDRADAADAVLVPGRLRKSWGTALLASLVLGISLGLLADSFDHTIRTPFDIRRHLNFPVLAAVPKAAQADLLALATPRPGTVSDVFDTLATVLLAAPSPEPCRVFLVTSSNPQEGKTAVSINLAVALARQGRRTLLVDGDLRIPSVHATLGLPNPLGLSDLLAGTVDLATEGVLQDIQVPSLKVVTSGPLPENPYELLDPSRLGPVGVNLRAPFDAVVIDSSPLLRTGDALKFVPSVDQTLFVVKAGSTDVRQATWAKKLLANVSARVTGVVLNGTRGETGEYYAYDPRYGAEHSVKPF